MEEILQAEELRLNYREVAPVDLSVLTGLGDVTPRELNKHLFSERSEPKNQKNYPMFQRQIGQYSEIRTEMLLFSFNY